LGRPSEIVGTIGCAMTAARIARSNSASSCSGAADTAIGYQSTTASWRHEDSPRSHSWRSTGCVDVAADHGDRLDVCDQVSRLSPLTGHFIGWVLDECFHVEKL
jgi:hypothetical protein